MPLSRRVSVLTDDRPWWRAGGVPAGACVAAYQPKGASSLEASYTNLANPGVYTCVTTSAPTWTTEDGWIGSTSPVAYIDTGIYLRNSLNFSLLVRQSSLNYSTTYYQFGVYQYLVGSIRQRALTANLSNDFLAGYSDTSKPLSGVFGFAGNRTYKNGVMVAENLAASDVSYTTRTFYLVTWNYDGSPTVGSPAKTQAAAFYNTKLTDSQMSAITNAMSAL